MVDIHSMSASQVEWNMANLLNIELSNLRVKANTFFISGRYRQAMDSLIAMKMTGIHAFTKEERRALESLEKEINPSLISISAIGSFNDIERTKANNAISVIREKFPLYNEKLMDTLHTHGFLGAYKKDIGKMKI